LAAADSMVLTAPSRSAVPGIMMKKCALVILPRTRSMYWCCGASGAVSLRIQ
jgi:hypothetical protein